MFLSIKEKSVYGNVLLYPNNQTAIMFATLINKKTFPGTSYESDS